MPHTPSIHSDYLGSVFNRAKLNKFLKLAVPLVKQYDFQAFAFCGMSGALVAPILAYKTNKTLIMVRKPKYGPDGEQVDHSCYRVEGDQAAQRYIIVDDITCSGRTVNNIVEQIGEFSPYAECLGGLFYSGIIGYGSSQLNLFKLHIPTRLEGFICKDPEKYRIVR